MAMIKDDLKRDIGNLEMGRETLVHMKHLKSYNTPRIRPVLPLLETAYTYLLENLNILYRLSLDKPE